MAGENEAALRLVDLVLRDIATRSGMFIRRRQRAGDDDSFVVQTGEEDRLRVRLPDLDSDASINAVVATVQEHLFTELGVPVPLCPRHRHALIAAAANGTLTWVCPDGSWECTLGDYEERTWPQYDVTSLAPILMRRLRRRGEFVGVRTVGVTGTAESRVAEFGLTKSTPELLQRLREAAAPLPVKVHDEPNVMIHPLSGRFSPHRIPVAMRWQDSRAADDRGGI